jgi:hypothetical protein
VSAYRQDQPAPATPPAKAPAKRVRRRKAVGS